MVFNVLNNFVTLYSIGAIVIGAKWKDVIFSISPHTIPLGKQFKYSLIM